MLLDPLRVLDCVVDVVEEDLPDAGTPLGVQRAEVDHPAVVGLDAGAPVRVVLVLRRRREQHEAREERRHGVGEDHLADDAAGPLVGVATLVVPIAHPQARVAQVLPRVLVLLAPRVEVGDVLLCEVLAVRLVVGAGVRVSRDERVVIGRRHGHGRSPGSSIVLVPLYPMLPTGGSWCPREVPMACQTLRLLKGWAGKGSEFMRTFLASLVAVVSLGAVVMPTAVSAQTNDPVRIGLEAPLTGDQKSIGIGMLDGAKLAASEMNARGGLLGRKVEIVPIDDAADPATGKTAAAAAIAEGLDGVVGPYNSGVGAETLPLYLAAGVVPIRLTSADATAGLGFTLQPMTSQIAPAAADALTKWAQAKSVAIIYDQSALYTQSVSSQLQTLLQQAGVQVT